MNCEPNCPDGVSGQLFNTFHREGYCIGCNIATAIKAAADEKWAEIEKYIEYYERALYNHILSTQHPDKGGFVYFTPMRPGHYRVYSQPQTSFWCCVGSGMENHAKYNELIYTSNKNNLYVNLFIPSRLNWNK